MSDTYADIPFPYQGIDLSLRHDAQRPGTTPDGTNVRLYEPSTLRARGGSRPGLTPYPQGQVPAGTHEIQDLNTVPFQSVFALPGAYPPPEFDPYDGLPPVDYPDDPGYEESWGTDPGPDYGPGERRAIDPDTGLPLPKFPTRKPSGGIPGGGSQPPNKKRDHGSGVPPNPNVLMYEPVPAGPRFLFHGHTQIQIHKNPPDPLGWNGQEPEQIVDSCYPYNPPLIPCPLTAFVLPRSAFPPFQTIQEEIDEFLDVHNVRPCTYTVILDEVICPPVFPCV